MNHNISKYKYVKSSSEPTKPTVTNGTTNLNRNLSAAPLSVSSFKVTNPVVSVRPPPLVSAAPVLVSSGNPYKLVKKPVITQQQSQIPVQQDGPRRLTANINKLNLASQPTQTGGPFKLTNKVTATAPLPSYVNTNFKIDKTTTVPSHRKFHKSPRPPFKAGTSSALTAAGSKRLDINIILGRQPRDLSKNKYKFIRRRSSFSTSQTTFKFNLGWASRPTTRANNPFRLSNRGGRPSSYSTLFTLTKFSRKPIRHKSFDLRTRGAPSAAHRKPPATGIINLSGISYHVSPKGNKLKRLSSKELSRGAKPMDKYKLVNMSRLLTSSTTASGSNNSATAMANNLVYRSILLVNRNKLIRKNVSKPNLGNQASSQKQAYCLFYNRFGRCSRGNQCPLIHDPKRIALCPRFLRGTCKVKDCPFSHDAGPEKTPLCSFFAAGHCNRENCPYSHIYLGKDAEFCLDFAKGFCALGTLCNKAHITECPDYGKDQKCPRGNLCPLAHRNASLKKTNVKRKRTRSTTNMAFGKMSKSSSSAKIDKQQQQLSEVEDGEDGMAVTMGPDALDFAASYIAFKSSQEPAAVGKSSCSSPSPPPPPIAAASKGSPESQPKVVQEPLKLRPNFKKS